MPDLDAAPDADAPALAPAVAPRTAVALAVGSGLLYWWGFSFGALWPCSLVALAPLLVAVRGRGPAAAAALGAVTGLVLDLGGFYWLLGMLRTFSGFPTPVCALFTVLLCAYQGGRIAMLTGLTARATRRGWPAGLAFALAFAASELLWPLLFPWYFGACVHGVPALAQVADLGGPYLVSLVLVAPSLALAELWLARRERRPAEARWVAAALAVPALAALYGAVRIRQVDAAVQAAPSVKVGLVQGDMPLVQRRGDRAESLRRHRTMTAELRDRGAELVVWSEAAVTIDLPEADYQKMSERIVTRDLRVATVFGAVLTRRAPGAFVAYNTALSADAGGKVRGRYDKEFLLAFGEYLPFGEQLPVLYDWSPNSGHLTAGTRNDPIDVDGHRVTAFICYEDILPSFVNAAVRHGQPEMLVNLTNDAWFGDTTEPWIHLALAKFRAIEHRRYLLRATNSGVSAVVDPVGRVVAHGGTFRPETVEATAHWLSPTRTGYELWGDTPWWLASAAVVAMGFLSRRRGRPPLRS